MASGDRILRRPSVFLPDPSAGRLVRFVAGDVIPERFVVGHHLFREGPSWTGHPQSGASALRSTRPLVGATELEPEAAPAASAEPAQSAPSAESPAPPAPPAEPVKKATAAPVKKAASKRAATKKAPAKKATARKSAAKKSPGA